MQDFQPKPPDEGVKHRYTSLVRTSAYFMDEKYYTTLCDDNCDENWFEQFMDEPTEKLFIQDADTSEGMKYIAKYFGVWNKWEKNFHNMGCPLWEKHQELAKLIQDEGNEKKLVRLSPWEGMQRMSSRVHFSLSSPIDEFNGHLSPGQLTVNDIGKHQDQGLKSIPSDVLADIPDLVKHTEELRIDGNKKQMHNTMMRVQISWITKSDTNADELCHHFRKKSENVANAKHKSAQKETSERLYGHFNDFFRDKLKVNVEALTYRPDFDNVRFKQKNPKLKDSKHVKALFEEYGQKEAEIELNIDCPIVDSPAYQDYIQDPKNVAARNRAECLFATESFNYRFQIEGIQENASPPKRGPPFVTTLSTMGADSLVLKDRRPGGKFCERFCARTANDALFFPLVLQCLFMASNNVSEEDLGENINYVNMQKYFAHYCLHNNPQANDNQLHGAYNAFYQLGEENYTWQGQARIIGATCFILDMISSTFARELDSEDDTINQRMDKCNTTCKMIGATTLIMGNKKKAKQTDDNWIQAAGK